MDKVDTVKSFWDTVISQDAERLVQYFTEDAYVNWHNTNEHFTVSEYIKANCEYPNSWGGEIERIEIIEDLVITVTRVFTLDGTLSFHATSFIRLVDNKITQLDEYWGDDGIPPKWRLEKQIGTPIK